MNGKQAGESTICACRETDARIAAEMAATRVLASRTDGRQDRETTGIQISDRKHTCELTNGFAW